MRKHHLLIICTVLAPFLAAASVSEPAFPNLKVVDIKRRPIAVDESLIRYPKSAATLNPPCGQVFLAVAVSETGEVSDVRLVRSEPPEVFDSSAIKAVRAWRYAAEVEDGKAIPFQLPVRIAYKIKGAACRFDHSVPSSMN
jgi:TonB family protein